VSVNFRPQAGCGSGAPAFAVGLVLWRACMGQPGRGHGTCPSAAASKVRNIWTPEMGLAGKGSGLMDLVLWI
jgi:hypothetical protein